MTTESDIDTQSRSFQLAVVFVSLVVILSLMMIVSGISSDPDNVPFDDIEVENGDIREDLDVTGDVDVDLDTDVGDVPDEDIGDNGDLDNGEGDGDENEGNDVDGERLLPPYDIAVSPDPVPGANVVVTVTKNGTPIPNSTVIFNGEKIGKTDQVGEVEGTVPYAETLSIEVTPPGEHVEIVPAYQTIRAGISSTDVLATGSEVSVLHTVDHNETREDFDLPNDITVTTDDHIVPGATVTATIIIDDVPVRNADVYVNNEYQTTTNDVGNADITVPDSENDFSIRVERDEFTGETTLSPVTIDVSVSPKYVLPIPGEPAEVIVRATDHDGEETPLEGATVVLSENEDGAGIIGEFTTGGDGTVTIELPWSNSVYITAEFGSVSSSTHLWGMYIALGGIATFLLMLIALVVYAFIKARRSLDQKTLKRGVIRPLIQIARYITATGTRFLHELNQLPSFLLTLISNPRTQINGIFRRLQHVLTTIRAVFHRLIQWVLALVLRDDRATSQPDIETRTVNNGDVVVGDDERESQQTAYQQLKRYWIWFVTSIIGKDRARTKTAVEIGEEGMEKGLPSSLVTPLVQSFRDVEYGQAEPKSHLEIVKNAVQSIRTTLSSTSSGGDEE